MTIDSADDSKISNRTITTNRISNRTYDSKSNRITKLRRSLLICSSFLCFISIFSVLVIPKCGRLSWPALWSTFRRTIKYLVWFDQTKNAKTALVKMWHCSEQTIDSILCPSRYNQPLTYLETYVQNTCPEIKKKLSFSQIKKYCTSKT